MDYTKPSSQPWGMPATNSFFYVNQAPTWTFGISRLQFEKEMLENGLANCVTYLQVLRKKQARIEHRLATDTSLPRKKRKKIQQGKRELEKEIKHKERDEQGFLSNLQACKANIYMAETVSSPSTAISSTIPDIASTSTRCSYPVDVQTEPTERSWNGWTDEMVLSPFQKETTNPFLTDNVAPDEQSETGSIGRMIVEESQQSLVSPNTETHFLLSAKAAVFQPQLTHTGQGDAIDRRQLIQLHPSSSMAITSLEMKEPELLERRLVNDAGIVLVRRQSSLEKIEEEAGIQTWANSAMQRSPNKFTIAGNLKIRTSSL